MHNGVMSNHSKSMVDSKKKSPSVKLTEAGNDIFGTIQEVINRLSDDPNTNWEEVNIEALRLHLLDMNDMTLNVEVLSYKPIKNGLETVVKATTPRANLALKRVFKAHPSQLKKETGWDMKVVEDNSQYILTISSMNHKEVSKIRALGYIGVMAYGSHHQPHHLSMAMGKNPHH